MQTLATYLLERTVVSSEAKEDTLSSVNQLINRWLKGKGVASPEQSDGVFYSLNSETAGNYRREIIELDGDYLIKLSLEESPRDNQIFTTTISLAAIASRIYVYSTLKATTKSSILSPLTIDARCPSIVRDILRSSTEWRIGEYLVPAGERVLCRGEDEGLELARVITSDDRIFPLVVVSDYDGDQIWSGLSKKIAHDLAGLAHVYEVDDQSSWALTDVLGKKNSCYSGAVRLYWPTKAKISGTNWTPYALLSGDPDEVESRFRRQLRRRIMSVSTMTLLPPKETVEIQSAWSRRRLKELEGELANSKELYELALTYLSDADTLREENAKLQNELSSAVNRAENAEAMYESFIAQFQGEPPIANGEEADIQVGDAVNGDPVVGEVRYYKKVRNTPSYDVLARVADCGHSSWQPGNKAEKAKKGVERLEGRNTWDTIQHCGTCSGGGMWRVKW